MKLIGKREDGSRVDMMHEDVGLVAIDGGHVFRSILTIGGEKYSVDVTMRTLDLGGPVARARDERAFLAHLGIVDFEIVEDEHAT